ncbi:MAG: NAD(P)-dependent glycerol-1-phosphate dehydrogenase [Candidatus Helarchaeota archaeon]
MIPIHKINLPSKILIGNGILNRTPELLIKLGYQNGNRSVFIVSGPKTNNIAGKIVRDSLEDADFHTHTMIVKEANMGYVNWTIDEIAQFKPDIILGIGGGKNIDIAKLSSHESNLPFISIPTTLAHDGVASPFVSLKGMEENFSITAQTPQAILADIPTLMQAPTRLIAAGIGDILSNLTAVLDWKLAHRIKNEYFGHYAALLSRMSAELLLNNHEKINPSNPESVRIVLEAIISSSMGMAVAGSSRPGSGAEHLFSHALERIIPQGIALHGEQCGIGTIMMMYLHNGNWKQIRDALKHVGAPITAKELRVKDDAIIQALTMANKVRDRFTILHTGLTREAAENLARSTGVID